MNTYLLCVAAFVILAMGVSAVSVLVPLLLDRSPANRPQAHTTRSRTRTAPGGGNSPSTLRGRQVSLASEGRR